MLAMARKARTASDERGAQLLRVGAFVRKRRTALGLSMEDLARALGYGSRQQIHAIERGRERVPPLRAYAWADALDVPRDPFFRFLAGEVDEAALRSGAAEDDGATRARTGGERELLDVYRRLAPEYQRRLRQHAHELALHAQAAATKKTR
jgi:transcriptional regulator with XRE-family HTH domain